MRWPTPSPAATWTTSRTSWATSSSSPSTTPRWRPRPACSTFGDVVEAITTKLIRRHPHVFGDADARAAGAAKGFWEKEKAKEKAARAAEGRAVPEGLLDGIPAGLPALMRAHKLQAKAVTVGFDWNDARLVLAKLSEEIGEIEAELDRPEIDKAATAGEIGDLLFAVVNLARHLKVDADQALRGTNIKFQRRFAVNRGGSGGARPRARRRQPRRDGGALAARQGKTE